MSRFARWLKAMFDVEETKRRGYSGKSKVYFDGRERLDAKDWAKRKKELWERGNGQCEQLTYFEASQKWLRCVAPMHDPHHVVMRGKQRDDRLSNLLGLCRMHHNLRHESRNPRFKKERAA